MQTGNTTQQHVPMLIAASLVGIVALLGAMAWLAQGETLFATLVQQGLAWCF